MDISRYCCIHRKVLNRIYHRKNYHPKSDDAFMKKRHNIYGLAFEELHKQNFILLNDNTCQLSMGGYELREMLNQKLRETYIPIVVSSIAVVISAIALILQIMQ